MSMQIRKATKKKAKLRMNIEGLPGGGKTYSAIKLAKLLIGEPFKLGDDDNSKIVVIDSERNSAELYADEFSFNVIELPAPNHGPRAYIEAISAAEAGGAEVTIVDSLTHEWKWCLAEVDRIKPKFGGNKWSAWSDVRPPHDDLLDKLMGCRSHLIATTRAKPATAQEQDDRGKMRVVQLGLEGIQDDMIAFAFGIVMRMDADNNGVIGKTRCSALKGKVFALPGKELADTIRTWLESGDPAAETPVTMEATIAAAIKIALAAGDDKSAKVEAWNTSRSMVIDWCKGHGRSSQEAAGAVESLKARLAEAKAQAAAATAQTAVDPASAVPPADASAA